MRIPPTWIGILLIMWSSGCAVMPRHIMNEAIASIPFSELTANKDQYIGSTVILGGYVLSVENYEDHTLVSVLQAPLGVGQQPRSRDSSQGRMTLLYDGFLDAEVYARDRKVTVGGRVLSPAPGVVPPYPHIRIAVRDIYLWPLEIQRYDPHWYEDRHHYPWPWHHPWHHHRWHGW